MALCPVCPTQAGAGSSQVWKAGDGAPSGQLCHQPVSPSMGVASSTLAGPCPWLSCPTALTLPWQHLHPAGAGLELLSGGHWCLQ